MADPQLFISHKHSDSKIAQVLAEFIEVWSNGRVRVHLSSSPEFVGPKVGRGLTDQLRQALWSTEVLILIYTSADNDWSYCMWECGFADNASPPRTNIIVFQCGSDFPALFQADVRVNARKYDDIKRFTDQFLREPGFFPNHDSAVAPDLKDSYVETAAKELHQGLGNVLPRSDDGLVEKWSTWPCLRVELPRSDAEKIEQAGENERLKLAHQIVRDYGEVVDSDDRTAQLFGLTGFPTRMRFEALLNTWKDKYPGLETAWFDSCCEQIMMATRRGFPIIRWTPMRAVGGDSEFTPVLSRTRRITFEGRLQFDIYFYDLLDPRGVPVTSRMIPAGDFFFKNLEQIDPKLLKLKDLVADLDANALRQDRHAFNRIPVLNGEGHPLYIIHRDMIDKFIVRRVLSASLGTSPVDLTLADLLADQEMKQMFENTFVIVKRQATLAEAKSAMLTRTGCSDVFVTAEGGRNEPVQGWLTNVRIARSG